MQASVLQEDAVSGRLGLQPIRKTASSFDEQKLPVLVPDLRDQSRETLRDHLHQEHHEPLVHDAIAVAHVSGDVCRHDRSGWLGSERGCFPVPDELVDEWIDEPLHVFLDFFQVPSFCPVSKTSSVPSVDRVPTSVHTSFLHRRPPNSSLFARFRRRIVPPVPSRFLFLSLAPSSKRTLFLVLHRMVPSLVFEEWDQSVSYDVFLATPTVRAHSTWSRTDGTRGGEGGPFPAPPPRRRGEGEGDRIHATVEGEGCCPNRLSQWVLGGSNR
eukprot:scaffold1619_cov292-Pavlova_lutheri.AAC.18